MARATGAIAKLRKHGHQMIKDGMTDSEIADEVGCHKRRVQLWRQEEGFPCNRQHVIGPTHEETMRLVMAGFTDAEAACEAGVKVEVFKNRRQRVGLRCGKYRRKQPNKRCKLMRPERLVAG